jgi:RNA polymerase sigma factor (sigma-70 family)
VADAVVEALDRWPLDGAPERPGAWLLTTARHKAIDRLRRQVWHDRALAQLAVLPESAAREPDDRLRLIFTCCHPALDPDAQVALTLRSVVGLSTAEIARAFVVPEATLAKRLTRAKRKIVAANIAYRTPEPDELPERLAEVLRVVYLVFNEGYVSTAGPSAVRRELADDAEWLAAQLVGWLPEEPEALGLLALIGCHLARWDTRVDADGRLVLLADQDRSRWDRRRLARASALLERAASFGRPGPYQIEAAIAAVHGEAADWGSTDWRQLLALYSMLGEVDRSPVVALNRAVVVAELHGAGTGLAEVDALAGQLAGYDLFHAVRASLLRRLDRDDEAQAADAEALRRTANPGERALLGARLS